jgi:RimJ/RimL family protein N-acetyltransferase
MEFKNLTGVDITTIHTAFVDAFGQYAVPMTLSVTDLASMMQLRSYAAEHSLGCFVDGQLVGFVLVGTRQVQGVWRAYDVATGVISAYQNQKIGTQLLTQLVPRLTAAGMATFQLEVLVQNEAAQALYVKQGFQVTRRLCCYQKTWGHSGELAGHSSPSAPPAVLAAVDEVQFGAFVPSWQNALATYRIDPDQYHLETIYAGTELIAYGIIQRQSYTILQLGITPVSRQPALLDTLLDRLAQAVVAPHLRILNLEADSWLDQQFQALAWENMVNQYEMSISCAR